MRIRTLLLSSVAIAMTGAIGAASVVSAGTRPVTNLAASLTGVSADSPTDAWAFGVLVKGPGAPLLLHWNGSNWKPAAIPVGQESSLTGVSPLSPSDAWAVGSVPGKPLGKTLTLHWNGASWTRVPSPAPARAAFWIA